MFSNFQKTLPMKNRYTFDIRGMDLSIANAIRRIILTDIPVVAFDGELNPSLEIIANDGPLHNEFMLHRFGLIPIHLSEEETDNFVEDAYEFELNVTNHSPVIRDVTSHDFTVKKDDKALGPKDLQRLFPVDSITKSPVLITRLRPAEVLHIKGNAIKSTAKHHAGFSPVSLCTFSFIQDDEAAAKADNILDKERAYHKNAFGDPTFIHFEIESETSLTPKYLVSKAIEILMQKTQKTIEEVYNAESSYVKFARIGKDGQEDGDGSDDAGQFTFIEEDDTFGNFLQSLMHNYYIREKHSAMHDHAMSYVGYYCPHPLDNIMVLRINLVNDEHHHPTDMDYVDTLREHCNRCLGMLQAIQAEWQTSAIN
jgi:DNA-directed RNA polymerase alpha subunit